MMNGATRLQPCVLLTGQAAGALAALSVKTNSDVRLVPIRKVQKVLLEAGAYLVPLYDIKPKDQHFKSIQRVALCGILKMKGEPYGWSNRTWFFPDSTISIHEFTEGLNAYDNKIKVSPDMSVLTAGKTVELLSLSVGKDLWNNMVTILKKEFKKEIGPDQSLNKAELSVIIDNILKPFEKKQVDFNGYFTNSK